MSEELQNDGIEIDSTPEIQETVKETTENPQGSDLAPEVSEEEKKAKAQAAFNKQYGKTKQAERERDAAQAEIAALKKAEIERAVVPPAIGNMPESLDFDTDAEYQEAQTRYLNNVKANERHALQQKALEEQRQNEIAAQQRESQEALQASVVAYDENAKRLGVSAVELQQAGVAVHNYGINDGMRDAILNEPDGPLITKYLAANPQEVGNLNSMNPYQAGAYMATLKEKAGALKPKSSSAPSPTTDIEGSGGEVNRDSPLIKGATFE